MDDRLMGEPNEQVQATAAAGYARYACGALDQRIGRHR